METTFLSRGLGGSKIYLWVSTRQWTPTRPNQPSSKFWVLEESRFVQSGVRPQKWKPEWQIMMINHWSSFSFLVDSVELLDYCFVSNHDNSMFFRCKWCNEWYNDHRDRPIAACVETQGCGAPRVPQDLVPGDAAKLRLWSSREHLKWIIGNGNSIYPLVN